MTDRPWKLPLTPSEDQQHVSDFLGLDTPRAPRQPRAPHEQNQLGDQPVVSAIPEIAILYQVQKDLLKVFDALGRLEAEADDPALDAHINRVRRQTEFGYRSLRTWLKNHG